MLNFEWLTDLSIAWAKMLVILSLVIALVFAWALPDSYMKRGLNKFKRWQNFKFWILILVVVQIIIYWYF